MDTDLCINDILHSLSGGVVLLHCLHAYQQTGTSIVLPTFLAQLDFVLCLFLGSLLLVFQVGLTVQDRNFQDNAQFFQDCFEAGRRFKIMNPDKMRSEYGKLVYLLMDSSDSQLQGLLEFKCVRPLRTVHTLLEECLGLQMLQDPLVETATAEIVAGLA